MVVQTLPSVRGAASSDRGAIERLVVRSMEEYRADDPAVHEAYVIYSLGPDHADGGEWLVAEHDGRIVGAVLFHERATARPTWPPTAATFQTLVVDPTLRRRGIGRLLVGGCIERARQSGATSVIIETLPWLTTADRVYGPVGFVRWPEGDWDGTPLLQRLLGDRDAPSTMLRAWRVELA